jgi:hypothetical protein
MAGLKAALDKLEQAIIELIRTDYSAVQQPLPLGEKVGAIAMTDQTTREVYKALRDSIDEGATLTDDMAELQKRISEMGADMRFEPAAPEDLEPSSEPEAEPATEDEPPAAAANN